MRAFSTTRGQLWLLLPLSAFMTVMMSLVALHYYRAQQVLAQGHRVPVEVVRKTGGYGGKRATYYVHFRYQGQEHSVGVSRSTWQEVNVPGLLALYHSPTYPDLFVADGSLDSDKGQFGCGLLLAGFCFFSCCYSVGKLLKKQE